MRAFTLGTMLLVLAFTSGCAGVQNHDWDANYSWAGYVGHSYVDIGLDK